MKTGIFFGWLGCMLWMLNFAISPKAQWIAVTMVVLAMTLLIAGTLIIGVKKKRAGLGIGLSLLSIVFGIGFLIMFLVPEKKSRHAV